MPMSSPADIEIMIDPNTEEDWMANVYYPIIEAHGTQIGHAAYD